MEKVLIFENNRSREYWFRRILKIFSNQDVSLEAYLYKYEIWFNGNSILFKTEYDINNIFTRGRHNTKYYNDMENRLENNFIETLKEIFDEETRD